MQLLLDVTEYRDAAHWSCRLITEGGTFIAATRWSWTPATSAPTGNEALAQMLALARQAQ